ncbi:hypothetical protein EV126DRAFT_1615 [Verticillium dahliae]|nr:hypothetical protein EV126DRAFT_1615 [Verticillium dahliae]
MRHRSGRQADWRQQLGEKKRRGGRGRGKGCASFATCKPHSASAREPRSREQEPMADAARHPRHLGGKWTRLPRIGGQEGSQGATGEAAAGVLVRRRCRWRWGGAPWPRCCCAVRSLASWVPGYLPSLPVVVQRLEGGPLEIAKDRLRPRHQSWGRWRWVTGSAGSLAPRARQEARGRGEARDSPGGTNWFGAFRQILVAVPKVRTCSLGPPIYPYMTAIAGCPPL